MHFLHKERIPEWVTSSLMVTSSVHIFIFSQEETAQGYDLFEAVGISKPLAILLVFVVGLMRMIALYINGSWKRTPLIRAIGSTLGIAMFLIISFGVFLPAIILALSDIYATIQAGKDVVRYNNRNLRV